METTAFLCLFCPFRSSGCLRCDWFTRVVYVAHPGGLCESPGWFMWFTRVIHTWCVSLGCWMNDWKGVKKGFLPISYPCSARQRQSYSAKSVDWSCVYVGCSYYIMVWFCADENSTDASIGGGNVCYHPCFVVGYGFKQALMSELYWCCIDGCCSHL